nr:glycosyltransferase family 4 protein [uncultured Lacibacter sp.]
MNGQRILFLTLTSFSHTGGIEKFNRAFIKALNDLSSGLSLQLCFAGMYDTSADEQYTSTHPYHSFKGRRLKFVFWSIRQALKNDVVVLGHLNLAVIGVIAKLLSPRKKLIVICHGIEVFEPVSGFKKKVLELADELLAVSHYTKQQLSDQQGIAAEKISVFPNTIDPFFQLPVSFAKPDYLMKRYQLTGNEKVIFTLTRLNSQEGYKGYDTIVRSLPQLSEQHLSIKYILAGKADPVELKRMHELIGSLGLEKHVLMPGFIADEEVTDHYLLADVFVMPSKGEGFGIVYTEAMACGLPVIAGNKDGSTEALQFGKLGLLVDPDSEEEISAAVVSAINKEKNPSKVQRDMLMYFSFEQFKERLKKIIEAA